MTIDANTVDAKTYDYVIEAGVNTLAKVVEEITASWKLTHDNDSNYTVAYVSAEKISVKKLGTAAALDVTLGIVNSLDASSSQTSSSSTYVYDFTNNASGRGAGDKWTLSVGGESVDYTVATTDEDLSVVVAGLVSEWGGVGVTKGCLLYTSPSPRD